MSSRTEREKMVADAIYSAADPELVALRRQARALARVFNATPDDEPAERRRLLGELFGSTGPRIEIEPDSRCDYGVNIHAGDGLFMNFGCIVLD